MAPPKCWIGLVCAFLSCASIGVVARPPSHFGYGTPPSYVDALNAGSFRVMGTRWAITSESVFDEISRRVVVSRPEAGCFERGIGRRAVCGYRLCAAVPGGPGQEVWIIQGFGEWTEQTAGTCPARMSLDEGWKGDPVVDVKRFCDAQPRAAGCPAADENLQPLSLPESTGEAWRARLREAIIDEARRRDEQAALEIEKEAQKAAEREAEKEAYIARLRGQTELRQLLWKATTVASGKKGAVRVYLALVEGVYSRCRDEAEDAFTEHGAGAFEVAALRECAAQAQDILKDHIRPAIVASGVASTNEQLKDLHAYTIASLRALDNLRQSIIEARQDRSARQSGIDERIARLELDLR